MANETPDANIQLEAEPSRILVAMKRRQYDVIETLLGHAENVNCRDEKGQPLLFHAIYFLQGSVFKLFLKAVEDVNSLLSNCGKTPLHHAVRHNVSATLPLIAAGCDVNKVDCIHGESPLHVACFYGDINAIAHLLQAGAAMNSVNNSGQTPLDKLLLLCQQPLKDSSARSRLVMAHTLTRMGFKVNTGAKGQHTGTRNRILRAYDKIKSCNKCPSLQHLCRLRVRSLLSPLPLNSAVTSLDISLHLQDFLLFRPHAFDSHVMCSHGINCD